MSRLGARFLCFLCLVRLPCVSLCSGAQQPPVDPAEIARDLLYHAAYRVEVDAATIVFRAAQFTYPFDAATGKWATAREQNFSHTQPAPSVEAYRSSRFGIEYRFRAASSEDEGVLEIRDTKETEPIARVSLWERQQLATTWIQNLQEDTPGLSIAQLARELEIADPQVAGVAEDDKYLWLAIRFSTTEGSLGIGSVVRLDPQTKEAKTYQPRELATSAITHAVLAGGFLWLGTHRQGEGIISPTKGLMRLDPASGEARSYLPVSSPIIGHVVTALYAEEGGLWVASDAGICRLKLAETQPRDWTCWRIVPTVRLAAPVPVSNRPGAPSGGQLAAGSYEVLWANTGFLEVATPDGFEGWVAADDLEDYARRSFDVAPYELANVLSGGPAAMRVLAKPEGDPLAGALVYRAPLERRGETTPAGWQRVRARVGWISRRGLEVVPLVQPTK